MILTVYTPPPPRGVLCSHAILLTERWSRQAAILTEMMTRMNQATPQPLLDMADKLVKVCKIACRVVGNFVCLILANSVLQVGNYIGAQAVLPDSGKKLCIHV